MSEARDLGEIRDAKNYMLATEAVLAVAAKLTGFNSPEERYHFGVATVLSNLAVAAAVDRVAEQLEKP